VRTSDSQPAHRALDCEHFPPCAGCPGIPVPYEEQLAEKRRALVAALAPLLPPDAARPAAATELVAATVPAPRLRGYRNQARLVFRRMSRGGKTRVGLGLYLPGTHRVVHIPNCPIQPGIVNAVARTVTQVAEQLDLTVFDERSGTGALRYLALRTDRGRKHVLLTIIVAEDPGPPLQRLAEIVRARHPEVVGVGLHVNSRHSNVLFAGEDGWTLGAARLEDQMGAFRVFVSARAFLQVNHAQAAWIYGRLAERLGGVGAERFGTAVGAGEAATADGKDAVPVTTPPSELVLDLYCGVGTIALHLARPGRLVVGVEESEEAVADARRAAHANGLSGLRFVAAKVEDFLRQPAAFGVDHAALPLRAAVLNPPRAGCRPGVMEALAALAPERIAYVSCRPQSMARDLELLRHRYVLGEATPVDMIPLTPHIEALCFLDRT
jgi:23S rRNA (uracil1939-C5)-methyltransferase